MAWLVGWVTGGLAGVKPESGVRGKEGRKGRSGVQASGCRGRCMDGEIQRGSLGRVPWGWLPFRGDGRGRISTRKEWPTVRE